MCTVPCVGVVIHDYDYATNMIEHLGSVPPSVSKQGQNTFGTMSKGKTSELFPLIPLDHVYDYADISKLKNIMAQLNLKASRVMMVILILL